MESIKKKRQRNSIRLWFRFEGDYIELIRQVSVQMIAPPFVGDIPKEGKHSGTWIELLDKRDRRISTHLVADDPFQRITEQVINGKMVAVVSARDSGTFDIVVPDLPEVRSVLLFSSRHLAKAAIPKAAKRIGRFELNDR